MTDFELLAQAFEEMVKANPDFRLINFSYYTIPKSNIAPLLLTASHAAMTEYGEKYCKKGITPQKIAIEYAENCDLDNEVKDFYADGRLFFSQKFPKPENYDSNIKYETCSTLFCAYIISQVCGLYEKALAVFNDNSFWVKTSGFFCKKEHINVFPEFDKLTPRQIAEKSLYSSYLSIAWATLSTEILRVIGRGDIYDAHIPSVWNYADMSSYENYKWKEIKMITEKKMSFNANVLHEAYGLIDALHSYIALYNYRKEKGNE